MSLNSSHSELIFSADDFGLSESVNEAVEIAHRDGVLTQASLMVAGPAAADAVARAKRLPDLKVGLHLVLVDGDSVLGHRALPHITTPDGRFGADQVARGFRYFFSPAARRELELEIRAQFEAFRATGLALHHADSHKHMHLHPTVAKLMIGTGRAFGLSRIRVPAEPPAVLAACGERPGLGSHALYRWSSVLRRQVLQAGLASADHVFGIKWSGRMTGAKLRTLLVHLPEGTSEIYFHPATRHDDGLERLMPGYRHEEELDTLLALRVEHF
ncbi:hopanoid biosynthesis-associated protein HpnK [Acidiphilium sp. AL]|uniref:Hopanoid biosynthesis-associated protein HpnK n=1 Tax=Acidiphilium iwatense TaxID=768198 RepID=A0ABS9E2X7_9PROT|nr:MULTISPECIES: hopanoid biosynthesis-associated protein HpnK [Acidiphilium]MCF3947939.1 hopanoid biosynthesis-associated protein HpnK [Acidiphilium iwatense]MCU4160944.1 hopanoid biosynthesis-associated protein HpnK [Acidiphilium sp. AL]